PLLEQAVARAPKHLRAWFVLARCHDSEGRDADAVHCYSTCIALEPAFAWSHFNRGLAYLRQQKYAKALADFTRELELQPRLADAFAHRALAQEGLAKFAEAVADLTRAEELDGPQTRVYFLRAR